MIVFPNCKINLGLHVLGRREDGYHNLETVFYPLPFYDVLEIIQAENSTQQCGLVLSGITLDGNEKDNLCIKAYHLLKKDFAQLPAIKTYLHKAIPAGAGLGGGSADGAFMLMLLNEKFNLQLSQQQLLYYALKLGSDCPFFIINKPCFAQQRGEVLEQIELSLSGHKLVLINPDIHINTGQAFTQVHYETSNSIKEIIKMPLSNWKDNLTNSFEVPVFDQHSQIKNLKVFLYEQNALYASMSGTGSTVYGIFEKDAIINFSSLPEKYFIKELLL